MIDREADWAALVRAFEADWQAERLLAWDACSALSDEGRRVEGELRRAAEELLGRELTADDHAFARLKLDEWHEEVAPLPVRIVWALTELDVLRRIHWRRVA